MLTRRCVTLLCTVVITLSLSVLGLTTDGDLSRLTLSLSIVAVVIAVMMLCTGLVVREIRKTNRPADEAYLLGFDMGYNKGWGEGRRAPRLSIAPAPDVEAADG